MTDVDDELLGRLRAAAEATDPVPRQVRDAAIAALGWRHLDAQLAELVADSAMADTPVRGRPYAPRMLTFTAPGMLVEVEVSGPDDRRELAGRLAPCRGAEVEIRWPGGRIEAHADLAGHFVASGVPSGPVSMLCRDRDGVAVTTSWTNI